MKKLPVWLTFALVMGLAGCESSSRFGSYGSARRDELARGSISSPPPLMAAPSGEVESSELPPIGGGAARSNGECWRIKLQRGLFTFFDLFAAFIVISCFQWRGGNRAWCSFRGGGGPSSSADHRSGASSGVISPVTRSAVVGTWSMVEATGARCKIVLSGAPKLEFFAASTSGCQNKDVQKIYAWELAGEEVVLYEQGGGVAARFRKAGDQRFAGASSKSGAPLELLR